MRLVRGRERDLISEDFIVHETPTLRFKISRKSLNITVRAKDVGSSTILLLGKNDLSDLRDALNEMLGGSS